MTNTAGSRHGQAEFTPLSHPQILLVQSPSAAGALAQLMLEETGFQCDVAVTAMEAIEKLHFNHDAYHAVLFDVQMPQIEVREVARELRLREQREKLAPLRFVAVVPHAFEGDYASAVEDGVSEILAKPFNPIALDRLYATCSLAAQQLAC